jgi:hypothetical protein
MLTRFKVRLADGQVAGPCEHDNKLLYMRVIEGN